MSGVSPIQVLQFRPSGQLAYYNLTATGVIKSSAGLLARVLCIAPGSASAGLTFNDANALVTAQTITAITAASAAVVTVSTGGSTNPFAVGNTIAFASVGGMTQINAVVGQVTAIGGVTTAWTITTNINSSSYTAYTSGGACASYSAANEIWTLPEAATANLAGGIFTLEWPFANGLICSAVAGTPGQYSVSYS